MSKMSELDIMRQEGDREPEDFEALGYDRKTAESMAEIVQRAEMTREARLEAAVRLILAIEEAHESNPETIKLSPMSRRQLQEALR